MKIKEYIDNKINEELNKRLNENQSNDYEKYIEQVKEKVMDYFLRKPSRDMVRNHRIKMIEDEFEKFTGSEAQELIADNYQRDYSVEKTVHNVIELMKKIESDLGNIM